MIIADTSALYAFFNRSDANHHAVNRCIESLSDILVLSPFVLAEIDYLVMTRISVSAELTVMTELATNTYEHAILSVPDLQQCVQLMAKYSDHAIGLADASLVVLAHKYKSTTVLTLDRRHFSTLVPLNGGSFTLLP